MLDGKMTVEACEGCERAKSAKDVQRHSQRKEFSRWR